ncbi:sporulation protein YqfD [Paenibacillus koleovorans]|uniref:sporulation protein YqfD n=1 Tax=Paenibacillus koleovorans TaxID=121608 RepID=UPI000FDAF88D|nr:sporulation protein YqfD [Paenibacillus koleovorans]
MNVTLFNRIRGYVAIDVRGNRQEQLLNALVSKRFRIWDVRRKDEQSVRLYMLLRDFFRLKPILKETGCRMHVVGRFGLPFWLDKLGHRKTFAIGLAAFIVGLYLLSSIVWRIDVEGNESIARSDILQAAKQQGLYRLQWKFRMAAPDELSDAIHRQLSGVSWVGVEVHGTKVQIKIVEATRPDQSPLMNPRHLVASQNALVTEILAETGKPIAKPNMNVKKGDILISGIIGEGAYLQTVVAKGKVRGVVWQEAVVEMPLAQKQKVYTGESKTRNYLVLGSRGLQVTGYGKVSYERFETHSDRKALGWRKYVLPIGWLKETVMESRIEEVQLAPEEGAAIALEQARSEVIAGAGKDAKLRGEKILLHEKSDNGKVYMKVLFEVEKDIAVEQAIVN